MSINIEAFKKGKDLICVHNTLYTKEEKIQNIYSEVVSYNREALNGLQGH